ncbi:MAG: hypothetical protein NZM43_02415 [Saprospiraceae bacterium]|nr:hypothetical protein [Saprospiraceae bacterium]MDW8483155.1 hypothetical protein [Saprospiraceae bacterium]
MEDNFNQPLDTGLEANNLFATASGFRITPKVRQYWKESADWGIFFSTLGFLYIGMMLLASFFLMLMDGGRAVFTIMTLFLVMPLVWLLFNFSRHTRRAVLYDDAAAAHVGFANLRRLVHLIGLFILVALVLFSSTFFLTLLGLSLRKLN